MNKPVDLCIAETREELIEVLEKSGLSIGILAMISREIAQQISEQERLHVANLRQQDDRERHEKAQ